VVSVKCTPTSTIPAKGFNQCASCGQRGLTDMQLVAERRLR
jgi:hypothetical protein